jgi:hypothetical protein
LGHSIFGPAPEGLPPPSVVVVVVAIIEDYALTVRFSAPVTTNDDGTSAFVVPGTNLGDVSPITSEQVEDDLIRFDFVPAVVFNAGATWQLNGVPACLDFGGATLVVPQGGELV